MVHKLCFASHDYIFLMVGFISSHAVAWTAVATHKLKNKVCLWDKSHMGNIQTSATKSIYMLKSNNTVLNVNSVTVEAETEGLTVILVTLWHERNPLISYLFSLRQHNTQERQARIDWDT